MKNIPSRIYIQIGKDVKQTDNIDFNDLVGLSWSSERIFKTDIVYYIRKKRVKNQLKKTK